MFPLNLWNGQNMESVYFFAAGIRSGADEGQVYFTAAQELVDFLVGFALDQLDRSGDFFPHVFNKLAVMDKRFLWRDHGSYCHLQCRGGWGLFCRFFYGKGFVEIDNNRIRIPGATPQQTGKGKKKDRDRQDGLKWSISPAQDKNP